jgi:hypothetical protein
MKRNLLLNFLNEESKNSTDDKKILEYLQFDLNTKIYSFGTQFKNPNESKKTVKEKLKSHLFQFIIKLQALMYSFLKKDSSTKVILSSAYFNLDDKIESKEFLIVSPPWLFGKNQQHLDFSMFNKSLTISNKLKNNFNDLINPYFFSLAKQYKIDFKEYVVKFKVCALFLPQDIGFFEKLAIDVFNDLKLPTFNFIHGLPGIYNSIDYNRADYLVVWGESIKSNFVKIGFDPDKIIVNGHPKYNNIKLNHSLAFNLDNILIITKSLNGSQFSESVILGDRSNLIFYLLSIKRVLEKLGVKSVRLRPHPSENIDWYYKYIDEKFFIRDYSHLKTSLMNSTSVIGGTSTTFLEALIEGVNYVIYEPLLENNKLIDGFCPVAPFDGSDKKVPVAKSEDELEEILVKKKFVDVTVLSDYISNEFNTDTILNLIKTN